MTVIYYWKLSILEFGTVVEQKKQFEDLNWGYLMDTIFFLFLHQTMNQKQEHDCFKLYIFISWSPNIDKFDFSPLALNILLVKKYL